MIQREIANMKGVPRDQPLVTNMMGPNKYLLQGCDAYTVINNRFFVEYAQDLIELKADESTATRRSSSINNHNISGYQMTTTGVPPYESMATGLTSLHSMNSGNNYISGSLRTRPYQPDLTRGHDVNSGTSSATDSSSSQPVANIYIISNNPIITNSNNNQSNSNDSTRSNSISSNDDDDSIDTSESALTAKRKYKRHAKPDRHAPIKPSSAYIMFSNDSRAELKDRNLSFSELAKIVGDQWKNLNNIDKQNYELMAMRAKDEYLAALERYRQTPQYHCHQEYLNEFKAKQDTANRLIGRARKRAKQTSPRR